jgi:hypothetical protein
MAAKRVTRVLARAVPLSHRAIREAFITAAVHGSCSLVLAKPI